MIYQKKFLFGDEARTSLLKGMKMMRDCVTSTMGPYGRDVVIDKRNTIVDITKDGVTVMYDVLTEDPWANMGIKMVKEASANTNEQAGDGTTTAQEVAYTIASEGVKRIGMGTNVIDLKNGITKATNAAIAALEEMAKPIVSIEDFTKVATIAAQDEEIGGAIAEIFHKAGEHGVVQLERMDAYGIETEHTTGMQIDEGYVRAEFITNVSDLSYEAENIHVLVTDCEINNVQHDLQAITTFLYKSGVKKCLIIADNFSDLALGGILSSYLRNEFYACPVKAPSYGLRKTSILRDICAVTGATLISESNGITLGQMQKEHFGMARRVKVKRGKTIITTDPEFTFPFMNEDGEVILKSVKQSTEERIELLKSQIEDMDESVERDTIKERLAVLTNGVAVVRHGAPTELERIRLKRALEDAIGSLESARESGILPGGGTAYLRALAAVDKLETKNADEKIGFDIVKKALSAPARRILELAGKEPGLVIENVKSLKGWVGYDIRQDDYADMHTLGVVDAAKVAISSLRNGVSCAKQLLGTEVAIAFAEDFSPKKENESKND